MECRVKMSILLLEAPGAKEREVTLEGGNRRRVFVPRIWQRTFAIT